jgi:hypothetical protein
MFKLSILRSISVRLDLVVFETSGGLSLRFVITAELFLSQTIPLLGRFNPSARADLIMILIKLQPISLERTSPWSRRGPAL